MSQFDYPHYTFKISKNRKKKVFLNDKFVLNYNFSVFPPMANNIRRDEDIPENDEVVSCSNATTATSE